MSGWTPGPWRVESTASPNWRRPNLAIHAGQTDSVATRFVADLGCDGERRESCEEANAFLIAAAPDLAKAAEDLLRELEWVNDQLDLMPDDYADAQTRLRLALVKAHGAAA